MTSMPIAKIYQTNTLLITFKSVLIINHFVKHICDKKFDSYLLVSTVSELNHWSLKRASTLSLETLLTH